MSLSKDLEGALAFEQQFDVSRETVRILGVYADELKKWNSSINLVAKGSVDEMWVRHIADSAQTSRYLVRNPDLWVDLGSGAGFPGLVIAIIASEVSKKTKFVLVESDTRKAAFLSHVSRLSGANAEIISKRIEDVEALSADIVSARALAPLNELLKYGEKHCSNDGICLFLKGRGVHKEIELAQANWQFDYNLHTSVTDPQAAVLEIGAIARV